MFKNFFLEKSIYKKITSFDLNYSHFLVVQGVFLAILLYRLIILRIYPSPPLFYNNDDTFMDFFNTCWWTLNKEGTYPSWISVYPPFAHFICYLSYFFVNPSQGLIPPGEATFWRYSFLYAMPFFVMIIFYFSSIFLLIYFRCKSTLNLGKCWLLSISLILTVPNLFLIERGNVLIYSIVFINIAFIISSKRNSVYSNYLRSMLIAAAAAIKPYLLLLIIPFKKVNYIISFIMVFIFLNSMALLIWQPKAPEMLFKNLVAFKGVQDVDFIVPYAYYSFSISSYTIIIKLAQVFLSSYQQKLAVVGLILLISLCLVILVYNLIKFFYLYTQFQHLLSSTFLLFLSYTFLIYIIGSLLLEAGGYIMAFFLPTIVLFVSYFPRAKFNLFEFVVIVCVFFYIPFLPENLYNEDFTTSYLSDIIGIPLKTLIPSFTLDPLFRPILLQLFFTIFISKISSEIKKTVMRTE